MCAHVLNCPVVTETLWYLVDCSPPGSSVHGILQAKTLEWVAISFCMGAPQPRDQTWASCIADKFFTIWDQGETGQENLAF